MCGLGDSPRARNGGCSYLKKLGEVDVNLFGVRFKDENFDIREFVNPSTLSVKELADQTTHLDGAFKWVVENIDYPWRELPSWLQWLMYFADMHILFRHPARAKLSIAPLEFWKLPHETIRDKIGDCEDGAFLLASLLRAQGEADAWAVIGYVEIDGVPYGHAWAECNSLVLETTYDQVPAHIPTTEEVYESLYFPEMKINDAEAILIPKVRGVGECRYFKLKKLRRFDKLHKLGSLASRVYKAVVGNVAGGSALPARSTKRARRR